jgi:Leucine-rich repeat (LRR) protein
MEKVKIWKKISQEWKAISKALRLSLKRNNLKRLPGSLYAPELVSLLLGGNPIQFVPESFFSNFPKTEGSGSKKLWTVLQFT